MPSELELIRSWLEAEAREDLARKEANEARRRFEAATKETAEFRSKLLELVPEEGQMRRIILMAFGKKMLVEVENKRGYVVNNLSVYSYEVEEL